MTDQQSAEVEARDLVAKIELALAATQDIDAVHALDALAQRIETLTRERDEVLRQHDRERTFSMRQARKLGNAEAQRDRLAEALRDLTAWADEQQAATGAEMLSSLLLRIERARAALSEIEQAASNEET